MKLNLMKILIESAPAQAYWGLKKVSRALILAELYDIVTTLGGLYFLPQLWETNPMMTLLGGWPLTILAKILATFLIVWILERVDGWPQLVRVVPLVASLPVLWNVLTILAEFLARSPLLS